MGQAGSRDAGLGHQGAQDEVWDKGNSFHSCWGGSLGTGSLGTFSIATLDASGSYGGKPHSSRSLGRATTVSGEGSLENSGN